MMLGRFWDDLGDVGTSFGMILVLFCKFIFDIYRYIGGISGISQGYIPLSLIPLKGVYVFSIQLAQCGG